MGNKAIYSPIIKERVIAALKDKGKTQKEMAHALLVSPEHLSRCLAKGKIALSWLIAIAEYLDCSPDWLSHEDAPDLSSFGYNRGKAIERQDEILIDLFLLLGFSSEQYELLSSNDRANLKSSLNEIVALYIDRATLRNEQRFSNKSE